MQVKAGAGDKWIEKGRETNIISRQRRESVASSRGSTRVSQQCENSEPRPPETTGAQLFGRPPKGRLHYKVKLASHEWAAFVQRLAESRWPLNLSSFYGVFVKTKAAECLSSSACRVTVVSATALKRALIKPVYTSAASTTEIISKAPKGDETMLTGNVRIAPAKQGRK